MTNNPSFWKAIDKLIHDSEVVIDRPKGSAHPKYPDLIYCIDYGYLKNTLSKVKSTSIEVLLFLCLPSRPQKQTIIDRRAILWYNVIV